MFSAIGGCQPEVDSVDTWLTCACSSWTGA